MTLLANTNDFANTFPTANIDCGVIHANEEHAAIFNRPTKTGAHHHLYSHEAREEIVSFG